MKSHDWDVSSIQKNEKNNEIDNAESTRIQMKSRAEEDDVYMNSYSHESRGFRYIIN